MPLEQMKTVPPGCEIIEFGRQIYIADPGALLRKGQRAAVWGFTQIPGRAPRRIATSGTYKPQPGDAERGIVRLANWCGPQRGWEITAFPCPPNYAGPVIGMLPTTKMKKKRMRGLVEIQKFAARRLLVP